MEAQRVLSIYLKASAKLSQELNLDLSGNKRLLDNDLALSLSYSGFGTGSLVAQASLKFACKQDDLKLPLSPILPFECWSYSLCYGLSEHR